MPHIITKPTVCICGSRTITNLNLDNYIDSSTFGAVITGGAAGIDTLAEWWAKKHKLEWICYLPNYKIFGRAAPLKRDEDMVKASDIYKGIREETEKYRLDLLHTWDKIKKDLNKNLKEILRFDIKLYHVLVVDKKLDVIGMKIPKSRRVNTITWGNRVDSDNYTLAIINIIEHIVRKELANYQVEYKDIVDAIIELAIDNELTSRTLKKSVYLRGDSSLKYLKRQLYPYFLMYLGYSKEDILNRMMEDKIIFELDKYTFERGLATVDLKTFINFCIKNQKHILKIKELEII